MNKRCVITGVGVVSPVGTGTKTFWDSIINGKSGISRITHFDTSDLPVSFAGEVKDFNPTDYVEEDRLPMMGRYTQFAVGSAKMAIEDSGIPSEMVYNGSRASLILGTTSPAIDSIEDHLHHTWQKKEAHLNTRPYALASIAPHAPTAEIGRALRFFDSIFTISTVCTSGTNAIGVALKEIRSGRRDVMLAGASESTLMRSTFLTYISAGMLVEDSLRSPEEIMRPFDRERCGGVLSEGAAFVVLEELEHAKLRGAHIYGELIGYGYKDKFRGPESSKNTMLNAMKEALADARIPPGEVDFVSANGVSTQILDRMETLALKELFGAHAYRMPISAIKSMVGIPNSMIGPLQLIATVLTFETDVIPPTINYETPDPECDLDYVPNTARINDVNVAVINNHALDGGDAALVVRKFKG